jgi:hypothetical protein
MDERHAEAVAFLELVDRRLAQEAASPGAELEAADRSLLKVVDAQRCQGAPAIGPEREPGAHLGWLRGALEDLDLVAGTSERDARRQAGDASARDHDFHVGSIFDPPPPAAPCGGRLEGGFVAAQEPHQPSILVAVARWVEFESAQPDLARLARERFDIRKHKTLATLRKDGSPRISGIELKFWDGDVLVGMMPASRKLTDLLRDPRLAVHSPTVDPTEGAESEWEGEAKLGGRAVEVEYKDPPAAGARLFRIDITEVSVVHLNEAGNQLVIESWHAGRGYRRVERD